ncbi:MAG: hypothetical protein K2Q10_00275 [Rhodospirillales bacterium]|nr:hypothetical protein [Rhodospirillales bacterium]
MRQGNRLDQAKAKSDRVEYHGYRLGENEPEIRWSIHGRLERDDLGESFNLAVV